jgi:RNA recognition motif-containing protein
MATKLFVGSLAYSATDEDLEQFFAEQGKVLSATVIKDRDTGRSKGFGFVEMENDEEAKSAISNLDGKDLNGRAVVVNEARPREDRGPRNGGGGGGGFRELNRY